MNSDDYQASVAEITNYFPLAEGPLARRSGSKFVGFAKTNGVERLIPFRTAAGLSYVVEASTLGLRFFATDSSSRKPGGARDVTDGGFAAVSISTAKPALVTTATHGWATGDTVFFIQATGDPRVVPDLVNQPFVINVLSTTTFTLEYIGTRSGSVDGAAIAYSSSGVTGTFYRVDELASPAYTAASLALLNWFQRDDFLYLVCPAYEPRIITGSTRAASIPLFLDGPYLPENETAITITPSGVSGSITLTASSALWVSTDDDAIASQGRHVRIQDSVGNWTWCQITAYTSDTVVTATVMGAALANTNARLTWRLGLFSQTTGWPTCGIFHEGRLWVANPYATGRFDATAIIASGAYTTFSPTAADGTVNDASAISGTIDSAGQSTIRWFRTGAAGLVFGASDGEGLIRASALDDPLTQFSAQVRRPTHYGARNTAPVLVGKSIVFVEDAGDTLRELSPASGGFEAKNASLLGVHLLQPGIKRIAYSRGPVPTLWVLRDDGHLVGASFKRDGDGDQTGWHRQNLQTGLDPDFDTAGNITDIAVAPGSDDAGSSDDTLWMLVRRSGVVGLEIMRQMFEVADDANDTAFVDSSIRFPAADENFTWAATDDAVSLLGLYHLEGETVDVVFHGVDLGEEVVADGAIELTIPEELAGFIGVSPFAVGLNCAARGKLLRPSLAEGTGPSTGKERRIDDVVVMTYRSGPIAFGPDFDTMDFHQLTDAFTVGIRDLATGTYRGSFKGPTDFDGQLCWLQERPYPGTILSLGGFAHLESI
jgi:hypothetical protein